MVLFMLTIGYRVCLEEQPDMSDGTPGSGITIYDGVGFLRVLG